jgi:Thioesterase-like superfamily
VRLASPAVAQSLYVSDGPGSVRPTELTRGPWDPGAQHGGAPAALLAGAAESVPSDGPMAVVRLTYEFLRPVPLAPLEIATRLLRPGRRVQLAEAALRAGGDDVARVTALRVRRDDVPAPVPEPVPAPPRTAPASELLRMPADGPTSFARDAMEIRFATGSFWEVGPAFAWFRLRIPVLDDAPPTPLQRLAAAGDFGNGIAAAVSWATHVFINPDLTIYAEREPVGEWVGLDAQSRLAADGTGVSDAVLHDERGRVGRAQQSLYVAEREAPVTHRPGRAT